MKYTRLVVVGILGLMLVGVGCQSPETAKQSDVGPVGPKSAVFEGLSPAEAARKINLVPGSSLEIRQTFLGFGAKLAAKLAGEKKEGTRIMVIERFAPMQTANFYWRLSTKKEAETSIRARVEAIKNGQTVPEPVMVEEMVEGSVKGVNLKDAHDLYLPAYWPEKSGAPSLGTSAIWLSSNVFEDLSRNRVSTLNYGILVPEQQRLVAGNKDFGGALSKLSDQVKKIGDRTDVYRLDGEKEVVEWPLKINDKEVKVEVIKARNWFGEIAVLNNKQNPLVLKMTFNPLAAGAAGLLSGMDPLTALFGYEVTALTGVLD